jgi:hypothetical protein
MLVSNTPTYFQRLFVGPISQGKQMVTDFPTFQRFLRDTPLYANRSMSHVRILNKLPLEIDIYLYKALFLIGFSSNKRLLEGRWTGVGALEISRTKELNPTAEGFE